MNTWRRLPKRLLLIITVGLALALACRAAGPQATPTAAPDIIADCFWSAEAFAWLDVDGNGTREDGEPPLAGVAVNFTLTFYSGATTDADGLAYISGMHPGACEDPLDNSVIAIAPEGYTATTELVVAYAEGQAQYAFGFTPAP